MAACVMQRKTTHARKVEAGEAHTYSDEWSQAVRKRTEYLVGPDVVVECVVSCLQLRKNNRIVLARAPCTFTHTHTHTHTHTLRQTHHTHTHTHTHTHRRERETERKRERKIQITKGVTGDAAMVGTWQSHSTRDEQILIGVVVIPVTRHRDVLKLRETKSAMQAARSNATRENKLLRHLEKSS